MHIAARIETNYLHVAESERSETVNLNIEVSTTMAKYFYSFINKHLRELFYFTNKKQINKR